MTMFPSVYDGQEQKEEQMVRRERGIRIEADLHTHTIHSSHAFSTIDELAATAAKRGIELIALTDHAPTMPGGAHLYYFDNLSILPDEINGVRVLKGVEANILNNGELDLPQSVLSSLEFVAAGLHEVEGLTIKTKEAYTEAIIAAMENPFLKMITHPVNRRFPIDLERVVKHAKLKGVLLELNASSYHLRKKNRRGIMSQSIELARSVKKHGALLSVNSDAHYHTEVGNIDSLMGILIQSGLEEKSIINTSVKKVLEVLPQTKSKARSII